MGDTEQTADAATPPAGEPSTPPELLAAPGYLVRRLYQSYSALWLQAVDAHLTGPQFAVLRAVEHHPGGDQGSLASVVALDRSTMADVARRLEDRGIIERHTSSSDTRRKLLYLTEHGSRLLHATAERARALDEQLLGGLSPAERHTLLAALTRLSERWEHLAEK